MKPHHLDARIRQALVLADCSPCPRARFGALAVDPDRNVILADGWNGAPRGGGRLCAGERCARNDEGIPSGTRVEVGCHHAEMNVICNGAAGRGGFSGAWLIVTGEPCLMCARLIHHAGFVRVVVVLGGYMGQNGVAYLREHGVEVEYREGPRDPRSERC